MTKLQFLFALRDRLTDLPKSDLEERLHFYSEMIEDRMEEGLSEEEAVTAVGSVDEIAGQIASEIPSPKKVSAKRHWKTWEIVLLALGFLFLIYTNFGKYIYYHKRIKMCGFDTHIQQ